MNLVTTLAIAAGCLLLVTAVVVFLLKREISTGGLGVALLAAVLITLPRWNSIKLDVGSLSVELQQTAQAAAQLAAETEQTAAGLETTRQQLATLAQQLEARNVMSPATLQAIRSNLQNAPRVDLKALSQARMTFTRIGSLPRRNLP